MTTIINKESCSASFIVALKDALNVINGKWKLAIVCILLEDQRRFKDIQHLISGITPRMISKELKELEINGIIKKVNVVESGLTVTKYSLTESGKNLENIIITMVKWGKQHRIHNLSSEKNEV